jgi:ABC-type amino acid transport substrate-binding protein
VDVISLTTAIFTGVATFVAWKQWRESKTHKLSAVQKNNSANPSEDRNNLYAEVHARKTLRVGCLWYPPFVEYTQTEGNVTSSGLYPALLKQIARQENIEVHYKILKWDDAILAIENRDVDVVACVLNSKRRRESCNLIGTLYRVGVGGVVKANQKKINHASDLIRSDVRIAVTKGEIGWEYAERYLNLNGEPSRFTVIEDTQITTMMQLVNSGKVDVAIADSLSCSQYVSQAKDDDIYLKDIFAFSPLHVEDNSLMIAKNQPEFENWLSNGLKQARMNAEIIQLEKKVSKQYGNLLVRVPI